MQRIQEQVAFSEVHGLFRSACASDVICSLIGLSSSKKSLPQASQVDFFVTHSSKCSHFLKLLALCHHLNLDAAIVSSTLAALFSAMVLFLSESLRALMAQKWLYLSVGCWPLSVFLFAYLLGHLCNTKTFWFDGVCADVNDGPVRRVQTLRAIPAFIAKSSQMLVLWDGTLFSRLWCNHELAVHAKTAASSADFKLVPVWAPLWTLGWLTIWCFVCFSYVVSGGAYAPALDNTSQMSLFRSFWNANFQSPVVYVILAAPCSWLCRQKLNQHKMLLDQMSCFDVGNAKCTLETDRLIIMEQVLGHFDEALEPPISIVFDSEHEGSEVEVTEVTTDVPLISRDEIQEIRHITSYPDKEQILTSFNAYVRGPLRDAVESSTGKEHHLSLRLCSVASLQFFFLGLASVAGCDGSGDCEQAAEKWGYPSVSRYMLSNAVINLLISPLCISLSGPLMLHATWVAGLMTETRGEMARMILGLVLCTGMLILLFCFCYVESGMVLLAGARANPWCAQAAIAGLALLFWAQWFLLRHTVPPGRRSLYLA